MSAAKSKQQLVRMAWVTELRRQGHRQYYGNLRSPDGRVCAFGLLAEVVGRRRHGGYGGYERLAKAAGIERDRIGEIIRMNDGARGFRLYTFAEIADVVEGWFK